MHIFLVKFEARLDFCQQMEESLIIAHACYSIYLHIWSRSYEFNYWVLILGSISSFLFFLFIFSIGINFPFGIFIRGS